ncbi:MAG: hypothetical protein ACLU77_00925 [Waltera sp.]
MAILSERTSDRYRNILYASSSVNFTGGAGEIFFNAAGRLEAAKADHEKASFHEPGQSTPLFALKGLARIHEMPRQIRRV